MEACPPPSPVFCPCPLASVFSHTSCEREAGQGLALSLQGCRSGSGLAFHHRSIHLEIHICAGPEEEEPVSEMRQRDTLKKGKGKEGRALAQLVEMPHDIGCSRHYEDVLAGL